MKLPRFGVEEWLNVHEKSAIYDIAGVSIKALTMEELFDLSGLDKDAFFAQLLKKKMDYGWIEGAPEFKTQVASLYKNMPVDNILQTNGATGATMLALYALIEPEDHVISMYPTYQQLYDIPKSLGADVDLWAVEEDKGWLPDLDQLRRLIRPNTKMICINNANNPTGALMDAAYLEELVAIAKEVDAYIFSDEVYRSFDQPTPSIVDLYEKGIAVNSLSKTYSIPGIRVGWVASNTEVADILRDYRENGLPEPDAVYGWELPPEQRKPEPWPLEQIMARFSLRSDELLMLDDLKPGFDMCERCGVDFAAAGWANDIPEIERFMRRYGKYYFKAVADFGAFMEGTYEKR